MVQLPTQTREGLRQARNQARTASRGASSNDVPFAKTALVESIARNALTAEVTGRDPVVAAQAASQSFNRTGGGPEIDQAISSRMPVTGDTAIAADVIEQVEASQQAATQERRSIGFTDQVGAAWDLFSGTSAVADLIEQFDNDYEYDPDFDYNAKREEFEEGLSWPAVQHIRENARSEPEARALRAQELDRQEKERIISAHGTGRAVVAGLVGGVADPVGWAAGLGVMKGMQLAGVGARAAFMAGNTGRGVGYSMVEGAAGNVAVEAMLDAAGRRVDVTDYTMSAGFGAAFGLGLSPLGIRDANKATGQRIIQEAETQQAAIYERATMEAGPGATADDISRQVENIYREEGQAIADIRMAMPDRDDQWMDRVRDVEEFRDAPATASDASLRAAEDEVANAIDSARLRLQEDEAAISNAEATGDETALIRAREDLAESEALYRQAVRDSREFGTTTTEPTTRQAEVTDYDREIGVDGMMQTDPVRAKGVAHIHASADEWDIKNPVDEARIQDLLSRMNRLTPQLASTGQQLLRARHPVARKVTGTLLESTTGASGRRSSAAIDKSINERIYQGDIEKMPHLYRMYRARKGGSGIRDLFSQRNYQDFNKELTQYRLAREVGEDVEGVSPEVKAASEMLDKFYDRQRRDMIRVSSPGHEALPASSVGYFSRRLRPEAIQNLSNPQRRALQAEYKRQLELLWDDPEFADQVAARIIEHGRIAASGGKEIPLNLYSGSAAPLLRNALENIGRGQLKLEKPEIEAMIKRITTKGPSFTKSRLDLDIRSNIRDPETGESFSLMDMYESDQMKLALNYSRRVSGEVALAKYGVMGEEGLELIRDALTVGREGQRLTGSELDDTLKAFDQIAAEFLGRPFGDHGGWFRAADNLRLLTASSRLGGMAFTQMGEFANAVPVLGVAHTMSAVKSMPRLISEVRKGKSSPLLASIEQVGGEIGSDYKVNFPFQNLDDNFVHGQEQMGALTRAIRAGSNAVPFMNGWHYVHAAQVRGMSEQILHKVVKHVRSPDGKLDTKALEDMGFSQEIRDALAKDMGRIAKFDSKGNLTEFDIQGFSDPKVAHDFVQSVNRGSKQIIQGTYIGETGRWAHNDFLRLLTQFRTFSLVSMEKQWTRIAAMKGGWKAFGYLMGSLSFALPIHLARVYANSLGRADREDYIDEQTSPLVLARSLLNYSSLSGMLSDVLDVGTATVGSLEGVTGVETGLDMYGVRGISDGDVGSIIPGIGYVNSTLRGLTSGKPEDLLRSLPGGNLPYMVPLLNGLKDDGTEDWDLRQF